MAKARVVIEIGNVYTKCGFAGEPCPRAIFRSSLEQDIIANQDPSICLKKIIDNIYYKHLLVNPKERGVVIVESIFNPANVKKALVEVLCSFEVLSFCFVASHLMATIPFNVSTSIVIDVGYIETLVVPVIEGFTEVTAVKFAPIAARFLHERIVEELKSRKALLIENGMRRTVEDTDTFDERSVENIKVKSLFVPPFERGQQIAQLKMQPSDEIKATIEETSPKDFYFHLDANRDIMIPGSLRESVPNGMFELCGEESTVATLILDCIASSPIDFRKKLAENIILIGGTAMLPGFKDRVKNELLNLVEKEKKYKREIHLQKFLFHQPICKENYCSWLGASIFGYTDACVSTSITRNAYLENGFKFDYWS